jgi:hypothetical protein
MIILGYIGDHKKDDILVRLGWFITRVMQTGKYKRVTHTECVHAGDSYKLCTIASSSSRDKGVRTKENVNLTKGNWIALDVPSWSIEPSKAWFKAYDKCPYDWLGAVGTKLHFLRNLHYSVERFFCNETTPKALPVSYIANPQEYTPSELFEILEYDFKAVDVTDLFFKD